MKPSVSDLRPGVLSQFLWVFDADIVGISQIILFYFIYLFIYLFFLPKIPVIYIVL